MHTHVQGDSDDIQGHCGIRHTAEGRRLEEQTTFFFVLK